MLFNFSLSFFTWLRSATNTKPKKIISNINLYNFALSDINGETKLKLPLRSKAFFKNNIEELYQLGAASIHPNNQFDNFKEVIVKMRKLDDIKINNKIGFMKIDVEGHEFDVLNTFGDSINFVDVIQFEFGGTNIDTRTFFQDYWYFFKKNNFQLYRMSPLVLVPVNIYKELDEFFLITNYLAKRKVS